MGQRDAAGQVMFRSQDTPNRSSTQPKRFSAASARQMWQRGAVTVTIRRVQRHERAHFAAPVLDLLFSTGPETFSYQFGGRALFDKMLGVSWTTAGTLAGFDAAHAAFDLAAAAEVEPVGVEFGGTAADMEARTVALESAWETMAAEGGLAASVLFGVRRRRRLARWLIPKIPEDAYYVDMIAVAPSRRGGGIGRRLLEHAAVRAAAAGLGSVHLDVFENNPAVRFYETLGFEAVARTTAPEPHTHGVPAELRMIRELGD